ncbi:MAG: DUF1223 domain-containing protein [Aestuariivita sp.]|nr:DUF1223 domain-containing protein [Aestuariivita sp.]MCY4347110.1 DUF1223 domain-containing protein [Aestuariivita sp.]
MERIIQFVLGVVRLMKRLGNLDTIVRLFAASALYLLVTVTATAQNSLVVVELYTSQGCSSCPPADRLIRQIAKRDEVVALSLHVDYWDYIGWKDEFALASNAIRQRAYAKAYGRRTIFTPEMIINGRQSVVGSHTTKVVRNVEKQASQPPIAAVKINRKNDLLSIDATLLQGIDQDIIVQLVRFAPDRMISIRAGENAGRNLTYTNVVTSWENIAKWGGQEDLSLQVPIQGPEGVVVLLQQDNFGPILAAAKLN